jgi:retron-type reverse transcriptase
MTREDALGRLKTIIQRCTDKESRTANIEDLHRRVQQGAYRAKPSRRAYIPKPDGRQRPLGIAALEDKVVQRAVTGVLNAIHEVDFLDFSHGFRPGRRAHVALDALAVALIFQGPQLRNRFPWG